MQKKIVAFIVAFALCDLAYIGWNVISGDSAQASSAQSQNQAVQAAALEFKVPDMSCANCALKLRKALEPLPCVGSLNFFPSKKLMQVELKAQYAAAAQREQSIKSISETSRQQGFAIELL